MRTTFILLFSFALTQLSCSTLRLPEFKNNAEARLSRRPASKAVDVQVPGVVMEESKLAQPNFEWPVEKARFSRGFLPGNRPRPHLGVDLAGPRGTPIYAAHSGKVVFAGTGFTGYGRFVIIETGSEWASFYGHLDSIKVKLGEQINKGDFLGTMGATGRATGVHLHFEIRYGKKAVDPLHYLPNTGLAQN